VQALVAQMDEAELPRYLALATDLREAGINTEAVIEPGKLARQFRYADRAGIRFVLMQGSDEIAKGTVTVKDLRREDQFEIARNEVVNTLRDRMLSDDTRCRRRRSSSTATA
jgi:histidyl-tRNA synthetase